jgi:hypothetical protein
MTEQIRNNFDTMRASRWVCPPLNYSYELKGKFTSRTQSSLSVHISACNSSLNLSRTCVNESVIDAMIAFQGGILANINLVNPLINPGNADYLEYQIEDKNFVTFSRVIGSYALAFVEDYVI